MKRALLFIIIFISPIFLFRGEFAYFLSIMAIASIYAIVAMSLNILVGYTGQVSLCHAGFFGLGAYSAAIASVSYGINPWFSLLFAAFVPAMLALFVGLPTVRLKEHYLAMATLGIGIIIYGVLRANPWGITGGPGGICSIPSLVILGKGLETDLGHYMAVLLFLSIILLLSHVLLSSRFGRLMEAINYSASAAMSVGIDVNMVKLKAFVLSASMAGLSGGLYAFLSPLSYINPDGVASIMLSVKFIAMVVIGGLSSLTGGILGALVLTWLPELLRQLTKYTPGISPSDLEAIIYGVALVTIMIIYPKGLVSRGGRHGYTQG
ncbi:MAG: branched-chain amino acid ABC transporter permease [Deltaproteobacteria bacterium]|nr:MAG: branched-chain amino acid ABC transporter permease [Deltaproteobacteria bacterium]